MTSHPNDRAKSHESALKGSSAGPMLERDKPASGKGGAAGQEHPVIFFDGFCGLCNTFVNFVLPRDRRRLFRFAPLQGETANERLDRQDVDDLGTLVLLDEQGTHRRSAAVVRILKRLGGFWRLLAILLWVVPRPLRDLGYRVVARYRYRVFGKKEACRVPTAEEREHFLP